jgi:alpha-D-xyloside xylohydrolase
MEARVRKRKVYLPAGARWTDVATGETHDGGRTVTAAAPIDVIPLFVKEGAAVLALLRQAE